MYIEEREQCRAMTRHRPWSWEPFINVAAGMVVGLVYVSCFKLFWWWKLTSSEAWVLKLRLFGLASEYTWFSITYLSCILSVSTDELCRLSSCNINWRVPGPAHILVGPAGQGIYITGVLYLRVATHITSTSILTPCSAYRVQLIETIQKLPLGGTKDDHFFLFSKVMPKRS